MIHKLLPGKRSLIILVDDGIVQLLRTHKVALKIIDIPIDGNDIVTTWYFVELILLSWMLFRHLSSVQVQKVSEMLARFLVLHNAFLCRVLYMLLVNHSNIFEDLVRVYDFVYMIFLAAVFYILSLVFGQEITV